jgi:hypothetical protein
MGHKDITMTLRYAHLSSDHKRAAVQRLEQFAPKVPTNFTTSHNSPVVNYPQVIEN